MLMIETYIGPSRIEGLGLFARNGVPAGTLVWTFQENFDHRYSHATFDEMPENARTFLIRYGFLDGNTFVLAGDHDRFTNHSATPNTVVRDNGDVFATVDIAAGEEITRDYLSFDGWWKEKLGDEA